MSIVNTMPSLSLLSWLIKQISVLKFGGKICKCKHATAKCNRHICNTLNTKTKVTKLNKLSCNFHDYTRKKVTDHAIKKILLFWQFSEVTKSKSKTAYLQSFSGKDAVKSS